MLFANHASQKDASEDHPYGHQRSETAAALKLENPSSIAPARMIALWVALGALAAKEPLFRYMLTVAKRVKLIVLPRGVYARHDPHAHAYVTTPPPHTRCAQR